MDFHLKVQGQLVYPRVHQKRVVVLDHKDQNCPEVYTLADAMVLIDGNICYQGNDKKFTSARKLQTK